MGKLNWKKAKKPRETEAKYEVGTVLKNGAVVSPPQPRDSLESRAAAEERRWRRQLQRRGVELGDL
jgi:hypothetical protein